MAGRPRRHWLPFLSLVALVAAGCAQPAQTTANRPEPADAPLPALTSALAWLAAHQEADGHWDSAKYVGQKPDHAVTSLALLALLYGGSTDSKGPYAAHTKKAIDWLLRQQDASGRIGPHAYEAGVTLMTLIEIQERSPSAPVKAAIEKAVAYAAKTQKAAGGWDYEPAGLHNNTGATAWWVQGLAAAKRAGFAIPADTMEKARTYFEKATADDGSCSYAGRYENVDQIKAGGGTTFLSAVALNSLRELDSQETAKIAAAEKRMLHREPERLDRDFYLWAWQVWSLHKHKTSAPAWRPLKRTLVPLLEQTQVSIGTPADTRGSWDPGADRYGDQWGRVGQTALGAIMLSLLTQP